MRLEEKLCRRGCDTHLFSEPSNRALMAEEPGITPEQRPPCRCKVDSRGVIIYGEYPGGLS